MPVLEGRDDYVHCSERRKINKSKVKKVVMSKVLTL
jgi:hypothetical protein